MKKEIKISVDGLRVGMHVSRLDRSWIGTPFILEGIDITNPDVIERVQKYCDHVYVDVNRGASPDPRYIVFDDSNTKKETFGGSKDPSLRAFEARERAEYQSLQKTTYGSTEKLDVEIKSAKAASQNLTMVYEPLVGALQHGREIDLKVVKKGVSDMVESLIRNPSAMMWIVQMQGSDDYTYSRALGTSVWCATFGRHLGLELEDINQLALGGLLLDVGKNKLPAKLLNKKESISIPELKVLRQHVKIGLKMLIMEAEKNPDTGVLDRTVLEMVATHHERDDGSGYPKGLKAKEIPIFGRIAGIVDSYDAITTDRPYTDLSSHSPHEAISELYELRGTKFQAELVEQFIQTVGLYPTGSLVELNTGQVGAVVEINSLRRLQPTLMLLLDENKEPYSEFQYLNLSTSEEDVCVVKGLQHGAYGIDMHELFL